MLRKAFGRAAVMIPAPLVAAVFLLAVGHARSSEVTPTAAVQSSAKSIAAGGWHTCALTKAGRGKCWGFNGHGQLGDGTHRFKTGPVRVRGLSGGARAIAAGFGEYTCALTKAGKVKCWGWNGHGQLGDGTHRDRTRPVRVHGLSGEVRAIAAGYAHTCAVTRAGGVECWGANNDGELGDGTTTDRSTPVAVSGLGGGVDAVAASGNHTCALTKAGRVKCWGGNFDGQLGDGTHTLRTTPVRVRGLSGGARAIAAGGAHTCALTKRGGVKCWGHNQHGQLGDGTHHSSTRPARVHGLSGGARAIAAGVTHTCALTKAGGVKCWGRNSLGQLGDGTRRERTRPVGVVGF